MQFVLTMISEKVFSDMPFSLNRCCMKEAWIQPTHDKVQRRILVYTIINIRCHNVCKISSISSTSISFSIKILDKLSYNNYIIWYQFDIISSFLGTTFSTTRCNDNNLLISKISSACFGQSFANLQERKTEIFYSIWYSVL